MFIKCKPCLAFDALCALSHNQIYRTDDFEIHNTVKEICKDLDIPNSVSQFCQCLYESLSSDEIEQLDIKRLSEIYPDFVHKREYIASGKNAITTALKRMAESGFEEQWRETIYPKLKEKCDEFKKATKNMDLSAVKADIEHVKQIQDIGVATMYLSHFSYPTAFMLDDRTFVSGSPYYSEPINVPMYISVFIHELCHGFSNDASREANKAAYNTDMYFNKTSWFGQNSGTRHEEEFVVALESFISVKHGVYTLEQVKQELLFHQSSCMPLAVILFDLFLKYNKLPEDMNEWIVDQYSSGAIHVGNMKEQAESILPGYCERFLQIWEMNFDWMPNHREKYDEYLKQNM